MRLRAILAIVFCVQAHLIAAVVPRTPDFVWPDVEEFPRPPLVIPTLTISTNDVNIASVMIASLFPHREIAASAAPGSDPGTPAPAPVQKRFSLKWAYNEEGARRVSQFTEGHIGQRIQIRIGAFTTPPTVIHKANRTGRDGMHGISESNAKAILFGLVGNEPYGQHWWSR